MRNPLHTKLCDRLGIEYPIVAFTHCKDVAVAVINAGGFAVLGEAMHPPEHIAADIRWIRERVHGNVEFLLHGRAGGSDRHSVAPVVGTVDALVDAALAGVRDR